MELTEQQQIVLNNAIAKWGEDAQIDMCIEEMSELTQALCKYKRGRRGEHVTNNIKEEIADVLITINQMALIFGFTEGYSIFHFIDKKINRLEERINL